MVPVFLLKTSKIGTWIKKQFSCWKIKGSWYYGAWLYKLICNTKLDKSLHIWYMMTLLLYMSVLPFLGIPHHLCFCLSPFYYKIEQIYIATESRQSLVTRRWILWSLCSSRDRPASWQPLGVLHTCHGPLPPKWTFLTLFIAFTHVCIFSHCI